MSRDRTIRTANFRICNKRGLHARASAKFVKCVAGFDADVTVTKDGVTVGGASIMGLMTLVASEGSQIYVEAAGPQSAAVLAALRDLIENRFGEDD